MHALAETPPAGGWTADDLDRLPEDGTRREIIDGVLHMSPSPSETHQTLAGLLMSWLYRRCPAEMRVTQAVEIRMSTRRVFIPDVLVVTAEAQHAARFFMPHEVLLAVEIVSPGSVSMDRVLKPALYAEAGIPSYWRVELEPELTVHTHEIDPVAEVYQETAAVRDTVVVNRPWSMTLPLAEIRPRSIKE